MCIRDSPMPGALMAEGPLQALQFVDVVAGAHLDAQAILIRREDGVDDLPMRLGARRLTVSYTHLPPARS